MGLIIVLLFVLGVFAIVLETVLPFGLSATAGFAMIALSGYLAFHEYSPAVASMYCLLALGLSLVLARVAFVNGVKILSLTPPAPRTSDGANGQDRPTPGVGDTAIVVQPLRPTGTIEWQGQRLPARSALVEREISAGKSVRISGRDSVYWLAEANEGADQR